MGMFDWIDYEGKCPKCGETLDGWQSKDGPCVLDMLEPWQVSGFHQLCEKCGAWVVATVDAAVEHIVKRCDVTLEVRGGPKR